MPQKQTKKIVLFEASLFKKIEGVNTNVDYFLINNIRPGLNEIFPPKDLSNLTLNLEKIKKDKNEELFITIFYHDEYEKDGFEAVPILNKITKANELEIKVPNMQKLIVKVFDKTNYILLSKTIFLNP